MNIDTLFDDENKEELSRLEANSAAILNRWNGGSEITNALLESSRSAAFPKNLLFNGLIRQVPLREWQTYWSNELADAFFGGLQNRASDPGDPIEVTDETKLYKSLKPDREAVFYRDNNYNNDLDKKDTQLFKIKIFISTDGAKLLRAWKGAIPASDELLIFLENNEGDTVSDAILLAKAGGNVVDQINQYAENKNIYDWVNTIHKISQEDLEKLLISAGTISWFVNAFKKVISVASVIASWAIDKIGELFKGIGEFIQNNLRISESTWQSDNNESGKLIKEQLKKIGEVFKDLNAQQSNDDPGSLKSKTLPKYEKIMQDAMQAVEKMAAQLTKETPAIYFAVICGIINGIVDLIAGIFSFIGMIFKFIASSENGSRDKVLNIEYYTSLILEYSDNFAQAISKIDWAKVIVTAFENYNKLIYEQLPLLVSQSIDSLKDADPLKVAKEIAYYVGYIGINIIICFIPVVDLLELTQVSKLAEPVQKLFDIIYKLVSKTGRFVVKSAAELFPLLDAFIEMLKKGTEDVIAIVKSIFEAIKGWLEELVGIRKKVEDIVDLSSEELDWMAKRDVNSLGGKVLKETQIRKLRGLLSKKNIQLIVDGDKKSIIKLFTPIGDFKSSEDLFLFMKTTRPPYVGMFNAETKQFLLSKDATEIVAFHEMAHVKHFETVGEAAYKTYSTLEKEMYVWKEIISQRFRWTTAELEDALGYINRIRTSPEFGYNLEPLKVKL